MRLIAIVITALHSQIRCKKINIKIYFLARLLSGIENFALWRKVLTNIRSPAISASASARKVQETPETTVSRSLPHGRRGS